MENKIFPLPTHLKKFEKGTTVSINNNKYIISDTDLVSLGNHNENDLNPSQNVIVIGYPIH